MPKPCLGVPLFALVLALGGCTAKQPAKVTPPPPPPAPAPVHAARPIRSQMPPPSAEVIEHCVITRQENANTVSCACIPVTTKIDSRTGHTEIVCKRMREER